ncbi:MAG: hypothetical protein ACXV8M_10390, partial [Candidatus Angelobacter sp.]
MGHPPTGTFAELGISNPLRPPSGLSRNQLPLLNNTPNEHKKQRVRGLERVPFGNAKRWQTICLLTVRGNAYQTT